MPRSALDDEPRLEAIRELHDFVARSPGWTAQRAYDKERLDLYFGTHLIPTDNTAAKDRRRRIEPERMATGEAAREVDLISSFYAQMPKFRALQSGEGSRAEATAERVAVAYNEGADQLNPATQSPWEDGVWSACLLGRSVDLWAPGDKYWWDFPMKGNGEDERGYAARLMDWKRKAPLPVMWVSLPAESTFPASLSTADDEAYCLQSVTWLDLLDMFSDKELKGSGMPEEPTKLREPVDLAIYSNRRWLAYAVLARTGATQIVSPAGSAYQLTQNNDHMLRVCEHDLNRCAIRILPALTTGRKEPPYYWRSVIDNSMDLIKAADKLGSRAATSARFDTFPLLVEHLNLTAQEEGEGMRGELKQYLEGDIVTMDAGDPTAGRGREDLSAVFQPEHGNETRELFLWALDRAARNSGAVEALEGQMHASAPAWSHNWSAEMAKHKLAPLTQAMIARGIDAMEMLSRAVIAFGEPIVLAKLDEEGNRSGDIKLVPGELERYQPVIAGQYTPKVPVNWRADLDLMMKVMAEGAKLGWPSPQWAAERFAGDVNFWQVWQQGLEYAYINSPEIRAIQTRYIAARFDADLAEQGGLTPDQANPLLAQLPPELQAAFSQLSQRGNGATAPVTPATQGAIRAGSPFSTAPGGPQPNIEIAP